MQCVFSKPDAGFDKLGVKDILGKTFCWIYSKEGFSQKLTFIYRKYRNKLHLSMV